MCPKLIFYYKVSVGWRLMWPTLILIMNIIMDSTKLMWPTIIGLFSVVTNELVLLEK